MNEAGVPGDRSPEPGAWLRSGVGVVLTGFAVASGLFLAWQAAFTLLLIFAGLLVAAALDSCTRGLQQFLPFGRGACFAIACTLVGAIVLMGLAWGGYSLVQQWDELRWILGKQLKYLGNKLAAIGVEAPGREGHRISDEQIAQILLPDPAGLFGQARSALGGAGDAFLVLFIGFFVCLNPGAYRSGALSLVPRSRRLFVGEVIDEMAETLRWWLVGQLVTMLVIALSIAIALMILGTPSAILLGLQAGLVNFIPYLGPVIGAVPIALAASLQGGSMVLWVLAIYVAVQIVEGNVLTPLIQRRAVNLQPALALGAQMVMGSLYGVVGIALATPLLAIIRVAIIRCSGEDPNEH